MQSRDLRKIYGIAIDTLSSIYGIIIPELRPRDHEKSLENFKIYVSCENLTKIEPRDINFLCSANLLSHRSMVELMRYMDCTINVHLNIVSE